MNSEAGSLTSCRSKLNETMKRLRSVLEETKDSSNLSRSLLSMGPGIQQNVRSGTSGVDI